MYFEHIENFNTILSDKIENFMEYGHCDARYGSQTKILMIFPHTIKMSAKWCPYTLFRLHQFFILSVFFNLLNRFF